MFYEQLTILVLLRQVDDPRPPVRLRPTGRKAAGIDRRGMRRVPNPSDLEALEHALAFTDRVGGRVTAAVPGGTSCDDLARLALAMGAERAVRVDVAGAGAEQADLWARATVLARVVKLLEPGVWLAGARTLDCGDDPAPALASARLERPCTGPVVEINPDGSGLRVTRKADRGGRQVVALPTPCTVLVAGDSAVPRYPDFEAVYRALEAEVEVWGLPELGLSPRRVGRLGSRLIRGGVAVPRPDPARTPTPDAGLSAFDRIRALLSGGISSREGKVHFESAPETADRLLRIMTEEGIVPEALP